MDTTIEVTYEEYMEMIREQELAAAEEEMRRFYEEYEEAGHSNFIQPSLDNLPF